MAQRTAPRPRRAPASRHPAWGPDPLLVVRCSPELRQRLKVAAVEDGLTHAEMLWALLDIRDDRRARQRRMQRSPLHRPDDGETQL
ncbi:hypothetical protein SEA_SERENDIPITOUS_65 [Mycobacterium phage Serendipitous]|uniref:Ribbon-helix-helix DNA binding domain protein n=1 Tax=Mycobacterium phage Serendipitous TaxID=2301619 RepID=A0A385UHG0_9CAUD|nr:hypothetical protein I5G64_gp65 [Mycobacterium phage Serendipitous]AYB70606.1 hypothetical protein SEA_SERENDIPITOUS_65 [Mycobacterium phage Serendipitous]